MKKGILLIITCIFSLNVMQAQHNASALGIAASYDFFKIPRSYSNFKESTKTAITYGLEYTETKGIWGYRAGIFYTRLENQEILPIDDSFFFLIDIYIPTNTSPLQVIDLPVSGQIYLGKKNLRLYGNAGILTSLSFYENEAYEKIFLYNETAAHRSLSFRGIYGAGITYQFSKHFGIDLSTHKKIRLHTIDDTYIKPRNSFGFQTKLNYIF